MSVDATNSYYKNGSSSGITLDFYHVPTKRRVTFKAFLTQMDDSFNAKYNTEEVYGRMDPFQIFQGTSRQISISWQIPAYSAAEAKENLRRCSLLAAMQYPVYERTGRRRSEASTIKGSPVVKVKFANLIASNTALGGTAETSGLAAAMSGLSFSPNVEAGFVVEDVGGQTMMFPKLIDLSCQLAIIHQHSLGWQQDGNARGNAMKRFPYNISNTDTISTAAPRSLTADETMTMARIEEAHGASPDLDASESSLLSGDAEGTMLGSIDRPEPGLLSDSHQFKLDPALADALPPRKYGLKSKFLDSAERARVNNEIKDEAVMATLSKKG